MFPQAKPTKSVSTPSRWPSSMEDQRARNARRCALQPVTHLQAKNCPVRLCGTESRRGLRTKLYTPDQHPPAGPVCRCLTTAASCCASSVRASVWPSGMSPPISQRWDKGCGDVASRSNIQMICVLLPVLHRCHKQSTDQSSSGSHKILKLLDLLTTK